MTLITWKDRGGHYDVGCKGIRYEMTLITALILFHQT
jgi:hypothetical protein